MIGLLMVGGVALATDVIQYFQGNTTVIVGAEKDIQVGAFAGPEIYQDLDVHGYVAADIKTTAFAATSVYSTTTLTNINSGTTYILSASGTTFTLPALEDGLNFRFIAGGALDTGNVIIDSAEGDNIEGTLIVAGAVVDCAAEDQINFVVDGENLGDFVEVFSDGTYWYIGESGTLTTAKMTCTDP